MISWNLKTYRPIGLDIGRDSIKMIQLMKNGDNISVIAADKVQIENAVNDDQQKRRSFIISAIRQMMELGSFRSRNVVSALPVDMLKITSLRLPNLDEGNTEQTLKKEAAERFKIDTDKDTMDYIFAGTVRQGEEIKKEYILFAVNNETVKGHIEMLEQAGLRPVGIDIIPCALFRNVNRLLKRQEDRRKTVVFVDIGSRYTTVVFGAEGQINFIKQIPTGGDRFNHQIAVKLGISNEGSRTLRCKINRDDQQAKTGLDKSTRQAVEDAISMVAEELAKEISMCLKYYSVTFRGKAVEQVFLSGGEAYEKILFNILSKRLGSLGVKMEIANPMKGFDLSKYGSELNLNADRRSGLCEWAVAVGLGLKGMNFESTGHKQCSRTQHSGQIK